MLAQRCGEIDWLWCDVNLYTTLLSGVMNHVHHTCLSLIWGCTEGASLSLQANEPCSRIHLKPLHDKALLSPYRLYPAPDTRMRVCTHTLVQLAHDHISECEVSVSICLCVCVCVLIDCLLFCPSITSLVKADRAVRLSWQEVRQTGVSVLASHPPPASAFNQLFCRLLTACSLAWRSSRKSECKRHKLSTYRLAIF